MTRRWSVCLLENSYTSLFKNYLSQWTRVLCSRAPKKQVNRQAQGLRPFNRWTLVRNVVSVALMGIHRIRRNAYVSTDIDSDILNNWLYVITGGKHYDSDCWRVYFQFSVLACVSILWFEPYLNDLHQSISWQLDFCLLLIATAGEFPNLAVDRKFEFSCPKLSLSCPRLSFRRDLAVPSYHSAIPSYHSAVPGYHLAAPSYHSVVPSYHSALGYHLAHPGYHSAVPSYHSAAPGYH